MSDKANILLEAAGQFGIMIPFLNAELKKISSVLSFCMNFAQLNKDQLIGLLIGALIVGGDCISKIPIMLKSSKNFNRRDSVRN